MKNKYNNVILGFITGFFLPVFIICVFFLIKKNDQPFLELVIQTFKLNLLGKIISLAAIPDLLLFFIFIWLNKLYSARGVLFAAFFITIIVLILKIIV